MKNLINALNKIQKDLKSPKGQYNNFGKYSYRSCEDILEAVKKILPEGYALFINDKLEKISDRYYIKATAIFTDGENELKVNAYAREAEIKKGQDVSQITGATSSYARKYALNGLFLIDDTKDADTKDNSKSEIDELKEVADKIKTKEELRKFYEMNKGKGKELDNYIIELSKKLSE